MHPQDPTVLKRFASDERGNIAVVFALALLPLVESAEAAIDDSKSSADQARMQAALDGAVLAGAKDGTDGWIATAEAAFAGLFGAGATARFSRDESGAYSGAASAQVPTSSTSTLRIPSLPITAASTAMRNAPAPGDACILTLDTGKANTNQSLAFNGAPSVALSDCTIRSNSSMKCNGHSTGATASIAVGTATGCSNPQSGAAPLADADVARAAGIERTCSARPGATWSPGNHPTGDRLVTVSRTGYAEYHACGDLTLSGSGALLAGTDAVIDDKAAITTSCTASLFSGDGTHDAAIEFPNGKGKAASLMVSPPSRAGHP